MSPPDAPQAAHSFSLFGPTGDAGVATTSAQEGAEDAGVEADAGVEVDAGVEGDEEDAGGCAAVGCALLVVFAWSAAVTWARSSSSTFLAISRCRSFSASRARIDPEEVRERRVDFGEEGGEVDGEVEGGVEEDPDGASK
uniref:Uncharacterized protein n=1 Tax=Sexangularia sp. CB-2014 TaxID=1486929 RepID=A0A7S1VMU3_9EUKA|mmetsp:Transcript_6600/g.21366  ORF Transcript_6600/g.21366 Transcript_6600/m.21366 type:complete len:140 (+) Transcript_6600:156-575(+)